MLESIPAFKPLHTVHLGREGVHSLEVALDAMPVGVSWARLDDESITFMNRKFTEIFGYVLSDIPTVDFWIDKTYAFEEDKALTWSKWGAALASPGTQEQPIESVEVRVRCKSGQIKTVLTSGVVLPASGWALATFVDITDRKHSEVLLQTAERKARENEAVYRFLLQHSPEMIVFSPFDTPEKRYVSPAVEEITGFTAEEYLQQDMKDLSHPDDHEEGAKLLERLKAGKLVQTMRYRAHRKDGSYRWVECIINGYTDPASGEVAGYVATVRDISQELDREMELLSEHSRLTEEAACDELTGIPNRRTFNRAFLLETSRQKRATGDLSVAMIDVDYFKKFNDRYGHIAGDTCLQQVARALRQTLRRGVDLVARYGGEEFVVLMPMTSLEGAAQIAREIVDSIAQLEMPHGDSPHGVVTVSVGVSCWPKGDTLDPVELLGQADEALYDAKRAGRNRFVLAASNRNLG